MQSKLSWPRLGLMWLAGIDLRLTILAVPPVLPLIHRDLALDEKSVAALTGLPVLLFGLAAVPGSLLIARIGARGATITGLLMVAISAALRGVGPSTAMLFAMTFIMGAGVAILQPTMPALVSLWFPHRIALATAIYANGLLIGEVLSASLTLPLVLPLVGSWEWSFAVWSTPVLATALLMFLAAPATVSLRPRPGTQRWWPDWRDLTTWRLGLMQGGASSLYFACNAFIPDYLHATGRAGLVNACLTALNSGQLPASFIIMAFGRRLAGRRWPFILAALIGIASVAILLTSATMMIPAAVMIGGTAAFVLILTLALPPLLVPPEEVHRLSAGMLTISYLLAFIVPVIGGAVWDATGITTTAFLPGAVGAAIVLAVAAAAPMRNMG